MAVQVTGRAAYPGVIIRRKRMIQYAASSPALSHRSGILDARCSLSSGGHSADPLAGMTAVCRRCHLPLPLGPHEIEIAAFVGLQDGLVEQMRVPPLRPFR